MGSRRLLLLPSLRIVNCTLSHCLWEAFFAGFAGAAYVFLHVLQLGARGLVYSNCVNMGLRIVFNTWFISGYLESHQQPFNFSASLPSSMSIAASVAVAGILKSPVKLSPLTGFIGNLIWVGSIVTVYGLLLLYFEREYILYCYRMMRPQPTIMAAKDKKK